MHFLYSFAATCITWIIYSFIMYFSHTPFNAKSAIIGGIIALVVGIAVGIIAHFRDW